MAELTPRERLLPSLLDRLTDEEPSKAQEYRETRAASKTDLRSSVLRDLEWLMNTTHLESDLDAPLHDDLRDTVINFGLPALSGNLLDNADVNRLLARVRSAILAFEPRILSQSLKVRMLDQEESRVGSRLVFTIEGTIWGVPMPEALFVRTEMDLELGEIRLTES